MNQSAVPDVSPATLEVVPLGGVGEFGMNMMAVSWEDTTILIDAGVMFPDPDQLGVDLIIPDFTYVEARGLLDEMEIEPPDSLYGLYQGTPLPERSWAHGNTLPDRVTLFQKPIEEDCEDEDEVRAVIGETLIHEVGHYFGLSEEEIEEIEERYWRGGTLGPDEDDE